MLRPQNHLILPLPDTRLLSPGGSISQTHSDPPISTRPYSYHPGQSHCPLNNSSLLLGLPGPKPPAPYNLPPFPSPFSLAARACFSGQIWSRYFPAGKSSRALRVKIKLLWGLRLCAWSLPVCTPHPLSRSSHTGLFPPAAGSLLFPLPGMFSSLSSSQHLTLRSQEGSLPYRSPPTPPRLGRDPH